MTPEIGKCRRCGGTPIVPGKVRSGDRLVFTPDDAPFWTLTNTSIPITAHLCMNCGALELFGDHQKAEKLLPHREDADEDA